ncbi:hypothetical protein BS78_01G073700 [Paspalum vaginatum]|nr:hypothetical protein BS78_01G073700 [Paspalum vaginatum]
MVTWALDGFQSCPWREAFPALLIDVLRANPSENFNIHSLPKRYFLKLHADLHFHSSIHHIF